MVRALRHFAIWLGVLALAVGGLQQGQLSTSVVTGAFQDAAMMKLMGHTLAQHQAAQHQAAQPHGAGGHSHKGHADCDLCGAEAALAFLSVAVAPPLALPIATAEAPEVASATNAITAVFSAPYSSRAPPVLLG